MGIWNEIELCQKDESWAPKAVAFPEISLSGQTYFEMSTTQTTLKGIAFWL